MRSVCQQQKTAQLEYLHQLLVPARLPRQHVRCRAVPEQATRSSLQELKTATQVKLVTGSDCQLAVSRYPMFTYNASSGGGTGAVQQLSGDKLQITFDASGLLIPALNWQTAAAFGIPIPPPLNIAIVPQQFEGVLNLATGQLDMQFAADFKFSVGSLYRPPSLKVQTTLSTEQSKGQIHQATGERLQTSKVK
eukprot:GHRR01015580.1.p1 GENE.GHRR01015580.1~~GHRR01015580.1.p1  ORF type:complete len:193 (+),score=63.93 GHRR01015580.1:442-1020(+)